MQSTTPSLVVILTLSLPKRKDQLLYRNAREPASLTQHQVASAHSCDRSSSPPKDEVPIIPTGRLIMGALYIAAGSLHFLFTRTYAGIVPSYLPAHRELVFISGIAEILGGLGVLAPVPGIRRAAAWGLVALLIAVFPANLTMIAEHHRFPNVPLWAAWLRLPLQLPLIYWAWLYTRRQDEGVRP